MSASEITDATTIALEDVAAERLRQHERFGDQAHMGRMFMLAVLMEEVGEVAQAALEHDMRVRSGVAERTEIAELLQQIRAELVQVAAVAVAMIEHIDAEVQ